MPLGPKKGPLRGSHVLIGLYGENNKKNLLVGNHKVNRLDIWFVASPGGPLPSLLNYAPGVKNGSAPGAHVLHRLK